jgi:hypothetical protein
MQKHVIIILIHLFIGFKKIMYNLRRINDKRFDEDKKIYLPMNFN